MKMMWFVTGSLVFALASVHMDGLAPAVRQVRSLSIYRSDGVDVPFMNLVPTCLACVEIICLK